MSLLHTPHSAQRALVYGRAPASEFLGFIGPLHGELLDIGPGEGGWADLLRDAGAERLVAVEPDRTAATVARARYDAVHERPIEEIDPAVVATADVIVLADCLEHLIDPWAVMRQLHAGSGPRTLLAVSVPNVRYIGILGPALLRGRFEYSDAGGVMDRGHLRWFTHDSMHRALESSGWCPVRSSGAFGKGKRALLQRISRRRLTGLLSHQIYVVATKCEPRR